MQALSLLCAGGGLGYLIISNLRKTYGGCRAVDGLDIELRKGEFFTLLGPSGCGKSTTLRCVAGLETPDDGEIILDGQILTSVPKGIFVPPQKRRMGFVPQSYATWPHMSVFENIEFGLRIRRVRRRERLERVERILKHVELQGLEKRYPTQLSGGQQQRVALARALVIEPDVLLLDEPLSNLDAVLRASMRHELKALQRRLGITTIYVTHDQAEAMVMSDRIAVMRAGRLEQVGTPYEIYEQPATPFVAGFIGAVNLIPCRLIRVQDGFAEVEALGFRIMCRLGPSHGTGRILVIRPERIGIVKNHGVVENGFVGKVVDVDYLGSFLEYRVECGNQLIKVHARHSQFFEKGTKVGLTVPREEAILIGG